jgi:hypothetical protein
MGPNRSTGRDEGVRSGTVRPVRVSLRSPVAAALLALASARCTRGEPPTWDGGSLSASPLPSAFSEAPLAPASGAPAAPAADAGAPPAVDPATLPQTRDRPHEGPAFQARAKALWDAVVADDPELALPFFFPLPAYRQVKAIPNPEADWKRRLVSAYRRDVHKLHEKLGAHAADAKLVELEVATERAHWVEPGEEGNKLGYWRAFGSKIRYETARGQASLDVTSLISWRGEWFVVHLGGFK